MLTIKLLDAAESEMSDAISWYEEQNPDLEPLFERPLKKTISVIQVSPLAFPIVQDSTVRRALTNKYPYAIIYLVEHDSILIVAVFHTSRNPMTWRGRID